MLLLKCYYVVIKHCIIRSRSTIFQPLVYIGKGGVSYILLLTTNRKSYIMYMGSLPVSRYFSLSWALQSGWMSLTFLEIYILQRRRVGGILPLHGASIVIVWLSRLYLCAHPCTKPDRFSRRSICGLKTNFVERYPATFNPQTVES